MDKQRLSLLRVMLVLGAIALSALAPVLLFLFEFSDIFVWAGVVSFNFAMWCLVVLWGLRYQRMKEQVRLLTLEDDLLDPFATLSNLIEEVRRKESAFSVSLEISERALFKNINHILNTSRVILPILAAELTLKDRESGVYHGSFLAGEPFRTDLQAAQRRATRTPSPLSYTEVLETEENSRVVYIVPLKIAGVDVALLRVRLNRQEGFDEADWQVLEIVMLQCTRALVESDFTEQFIRMRQESEASVKSKTGFLAHLSHEIRGPLGIMLNAVELVLEELCGEINEDQRETLAMVRQNGSHLLDLVNDVLDYAKVEAGRMTSERDKIQALDLLTDLANIANKFAEAKGHNLRVKMPGQEAYFLCDRLQSRQILINLLTNAVKYTPDHGVIEVWVDVYDTHLRFNVKDSGIGIAQQDRDKVFAPFERIEQGYAKSQKGTGIGMNLTRQLVELNYGAIDFISEVGVGSHFWVDFERCYPPAQAGQELGEQNEVTIDGHGMSVIVLSSEEGERSMIARYLKHHHFNVYPSQNLLDAHTMLVNNPADVVILDLKLVEDDDLTRVLEDLRGSGVPDKWLPIVALTGEAFRSDIEGVIRAGVDRCVVKPLSLKDLVKACWEVGKYPAS